MRFETSGKAAAAKPEIHAFWCEGCRAEDFWQENRGGDQVTFWREFEAKFPKITKYAKHVGLFGGDCNNALAGKLDFGAVEELATMELHGAEIWFSTLVWHFADWTPMGVFLERMFDCTFNWVSDEYVDPFNAI
jgi:hypothetical protein